MVHCLWTRADLVVSHVSRRSSGWIIRLYVHWSRSSFLTEFRPASSACSSLLVIIPKPSLLWLVEHSLVDKPRFSVPPSHQLSAVWDVSLGLLLDQTCQVIGAWLRLSGWLLVVCFPDLVKSPLLPRPVSSPLSKIKINLFGTTH